jgi:hypothetical protein
MVVYELTIIITIIIKVILVKFNEVIHLLK